MGKEKRKSRPNKQRWIILTIVLLSIIWFVGACSYYFLPGHSLSYFSRFETEEEVVAFLHDNFDLQVTTSDEILTFMNSYRIERDECRESDPDEDMTYVISCFVPVWHAFPGTRYYRLIFYITNDDLLEYIGAQYGCLCL